MLRWLFEDRTLEAVKAEMYDALAYIGALRKEVARKKRRKGFTGRVGMKDMLMKGNTHLSSKISVPEYRLGRSLQALLTPRNFSFFAEKLALTAPAHMRDQPEIGLAQIKQHELVLEVDSLEPMWQGARKRIGSYIRDYVRLMDMEISIPKADSDLAEALRGLSSEIIKLYNEADPRAGDAISRQAHRKLLDFNLTQTTAMPPEDEAVEPAEVQVSHAYEVLVAEKKNKNITQQEFVKEVAALVSRLPRRVRTQWLKSVATKNNYHLSYAKYIGKSIAPLVAVLDKAFNPREIVRVMGHHFEPDYLLKTLDGQTVWGEYLGMAGEKTSGGAHYNVRSEFKKMGYGTKGVFFTPGHLTRFPNPGVLQVLHAANVVGFDAHEKEYFVMLGNERDFIRTRPKS